MKLPMKTAPFCSLVATILVAATLTTSPGDAQTRRPSQTAPSSTVVPPTSVPSMVSPNPTGT